MSVCFGVIVRIRINQRCVYVTSVVLVRFAPGAPGVRAVSLVLRSASWAGFSDGVISRRLRGQDPLQYRYENTSDSRSASLERVRRTHDYVKLCRGGSCGLTVGADLHYEQGLTLSDSRHRGYSEEVLGSANPIFNSKGRDVKHALQRYVALPDGAEISLVKAGMTKIVGRGMMRM